MSDGALRHLIAFIGVLIAGVIFWAGYMAGQFGWWWSGILVIAVYFIVYKLVNAD